MPAAIATTVRSCSAEPPVVLTNTGGFLDHVNRRVGGYNMAKRVAREALGIRGRWDLR